MPPDDFTIYRTIDQVQNFGQEILQQLSEELTTLVSSKKIFSETVTFRMRHADNSLLCRARALGCWCWRGATLSITLRVLEKKIIKGGMPDKAERLTVYSIDQYGLLGNVAEPFDWTPDTDIGEVSEGELRPREVTTKNPTVPAKATARTLDDLLSGPFLFSFDALADQLFPALFSPESETNWNSTAKVLRHGLVVVSGQTGSGKSQVMQRLVKKYLSHFDEQKWGKKGRWPHVVTIENPIEEPLIRREGFPENMATTFEPRIDYTPREIGKDVSSLKSGLLDVLRQTPAVVVIGETRKKKDWEDLLDFAATGHLLITTCHAGSLVETMRKIIEATEATTPDLRSSLVEKIVGVVHLQKFALPGEWPNAALQNELFGKVQAMTLPAVWRNAHESSNFFVSDGLGAILPRRRTADGATCRATSSCRGHADFAEDLLRPFESRHAAAVRRTKLLALRSDLKGV